MKIVILLLGVCFISSVFSFTTMHYNNLTATNQSDNISHSRQKRFLIFNYGGLVKIVLGFISGVDFFPKRPTGNIIIVNNFQAQYLVPPNVTTIFNRFSARKLEERIQRDVNSDEPSSREIAYLLLENMLEKRGKDGKSCLLRSICETAETPLHHNGIIGEVLHSIFTPGTKEKIGDDYRKAMLAGQNGVDCLNIYPKCPHGDGFLDSISFIEDNFLGNKI